MTTYRIEIQHLDGAWHNPGKLSNFVDGAWVFPTFATKADAEAAIAEHYADVLPGSKRIVRDGRTLDQIELDLSRVRAAHADILRYAQDLHALPVVNRIYVAGFEYGLFLSPTGGLGGVRQARLFPHAKAANALAARTRNGKGEPARVYRFDDAVCLCLSLNADVRKALGDCLADLYQERADLEDRERDADAAFLDRCASEGAYYDQFA